MNEYKFNDENRIANSVESELSEPSQEIKEIFNESLKSVHQFLIKNKIVVDSKNIAIAITKNDSRYAYYTNGRVIIWEDALKKGAQHLKYIFTHEILHALSYNKISLLNSKVRLRGGYKVQNAKNFDGDVEKFKTIVPQTLFQAFNEGITDMFTQSIIKSGGNYEEFVYQEEIDMIFEIMNRVCKQEDGCLFDLAQSYFSGNLKFMQKIKKIYGKMSIKLLAELQTIKFIKLTKKEDNLDKALIRRKNILEFFMTNNKARREELRVKLI